MPLTEFKARMDQFITALKSARKQTGAEEIYVAGEKSAYTEEVREQLGVALDLKTIEMIKQLCEESGVRYTLAA
jgi:LDH2 family malate/lactate/ureidoglycolate dehydrogenase